MQLGHLPASALPAWARLNDVELVKVEVQDVQHRGNGLVASEHLQTPSEGDGSLAVMRVPRDLILSACAVAEYAKINQQFQQLLEAAGGKSTRGDIMLYLLNQYMLSQPDQRGSRAGPSTPWTEYIKFLPHQLDLPTLWTENERSLLAGTSLESAVEAKLGSLTAEFDTLRDESASIPFWSSFLCENDAITVELWILMDAWHRSRVLELPQAGHAMVPALDMANHSREWTAYYEEDQAGGVSLLLRRGCDLGPGAEVTISYGETKSAAEMLFSYGFIDRDQDPTNSEMTLPLEPLPDDPLGRAKMHAFDGSQMVRLSRTDGKVKWHSPFAHLVCLNEEDGLDFRVLQESEGGQRQLRVFWQGEDVTERTDDFETLTRDHPLFQVFNLRTISVLHGLVAGQLERIHQSMMPVPSSGQSEVLDGQDAISEQRAQAAKLLREIEATLLESAAEALAEQTSILLADEHVAAYLGSMEDTQSGQAARSPSNESEDFS